MNATFGRSGVLLAFLAAVIGMAAIGTGLARRRPEPLRNGVECPECKFVMITNSKFCSECGCKLGATGSPDDAEKKAA